MVKGGREVNKVELLRSRWQSFLQTFCLTFLHFCFSLDLTQVCLGTEAHFSTGFCTGYWEHSRTPYWLTPQSWNTARYNQVRQGLLFYRSCNSNPRGGRKLQQKAPVGQKDRCMAMIVGRLGGRKYQLVQDMTAQAGIYKWCAEIIWVFQDRTGLP